jgi:hypothetical protein
MDKHESARPRQWSEFVNLEGDFMAKWYDQMTL